MKQKAFITLVAIIAILSLSACNLFASGADASVGSQGPSTPPPSDASQPTMVDPAWTTAWNVAYTDLGEHYGYYRCNGPAVCEWWDQLADGYEHEGFVILREGEYVEFPASYGLVIRVWSLNSTQDADRLITTYRHLVFYANQFDQAYWTQVFGEDKYVRYLGGLTLQPKPQHSYMSEHVCNFADQSGCKELDSKVRHLPLLITISN